MRFLQDESFIQISHRFLFEFPRKKPEAQHETRLRRETRFKGVSLHAAPCPSASFFVLIYFRRASGGLRVSKVEYLSQRHVSASFCFENDLQTSTNLIARRWRPARRRSGAICLIAFNQRD